MTLTTTTRVLVVDDHAHAREAIREILEMDDHFNVIGIVSTIWIEPPRQGSQQMQTMLDIAKRLFGLQA